MKLNKEFQPFSMVDFITCLIAIKGWHYDFLTRFKDKDKIKTAIILMRLNLPSCEVKNQLTFYNVRWFKCSFCNSVYLMF